MGMLFGTDGIRSVAGEYPLDRNTIYRTAYCLTRYLQSSHERPRILIGRDTRISGPWIEALLRRAIENAGGMPENCGVVSTPAVSFLTRRTGAQAGIVISASHNPFQDNGVKIFSSEGVKLTDAVEEELEGKILSTACTAPAIPEAEESELLLEVPRYTELYADFLRSCVPQEFRLDGMRLVVDCANGSLSAPAPAFLSALGAEVRAIHCSPDGRNINRDAGALHLESLQREVKAWGGHLGIAFDGDADRAMFVDAGGTVRDGDDVLYLLARYYDMDGAPKKVVGTVMANLGLEVALETLGIGLVRAAVGDRYVLEEMQRLGAVVGGEQSGHVILTKLASTGDGLLTALKVLEILQAERREITELCRPLTRFPQILLNVPVQEKAPFDRIPGLRDAEAECKAALGPRSRILLRYSGTEKLARVMVEGEEKAKVEQAAHRLATCFEKSAAAEV